MREHLTMIKTEMILKVLVIITLLLNVSFMAFGQKTIRMTVGQDVKLALMEDDHGNEPFTLNSVVRFSFEGVETKYGYGVMVMEYEFADLSAEYHRWSYGFGFNAYLKINDNYYLDIMPVVQFGNIARGHSNHLPFTFVGNIDIKIPIYRGCKLLIMTQATLRSDLKERPIRTSLMLGISIPIYRL